MLGGIGVEWKRCIYLPSWLDVQSALVSDMRLLVDRVNSNSPIDRSKQKDLHFKKKEKKKIGASSEL